MNEGRSEAGQDEWVLERLGGKRNGFFVDAGAHDGYLCSNTWRLEKNRGWKGICIEASTPNFAALVKRRGCRCVKACLHSERVDVRFFEFGVTSSVVSDGREIGEVVPGIPLADVLEECGAPPVIDYLSLDIEGHEHEVMRVFPFDRWSFRTVTVEHNEYSVGPANKLRLRELFTANGYTLDRGDVCTPDGKCYEDWFVRSGRGSKVPRSHAA